MNVEEAAFVLRKVQAYRPSQIIDSFTVEAWQEALDDIRYEDALLAVRNLGRASGAYLEPSKIRVEAERLRAERKHAANEDKCYICGGTWEQCSKRYAFETRRGVPDPHEFESSLTAERNAVPLRERPDIMEQVKHLLDNKNLAKGAG